MSRMQYFQPKGRRMAIDMAHALSCTGMAGRCPGGRVILSGYTCIHCGHDTSVDRNFCGSPVGSDGVSLIRRRDQPKEDGDAA